MSMFWPFFSLKVRRSQHDVGDAELRPPSGGRSGRRTVARRVPQVLGETCHHVVVIRLLKLQQQVGTCRRRDLTGPDLSGSSCDWPLCQSGHSQFSLQEKRQNSLRLLVCLAVFSVYYSLFSFSLIFYLLRAPHPERPELGLFYHRIASGYCQWNIEQFTKGNVTSLVSEKNQKRLCLCVFLPTLFCNFVWE